jgi:hypothetical protein
MTATNTNCGSCSNARWLLEYKTIVGVCGNKEEKCTVVYGYYGMVPQRELVDTFACIFMWLQAFKIWWEGKIVVFPTRICLGGKITFHTTKYFLFGCKYFPPHFNDCPLNGMDKGIFIGLWSYKNDLAHDLAHDIVQPWWMVFNKHKNLFLVSKKPSHNGSCIVRLFFWHGIICRKRFHDRSWTRILDYTFGM